MDPFNCPGPECHAGDFPGFDHFCDALEVTDSEVPHAFAAYLSHRTEWDGPYGPLASCPVTDFRTPMQRAWANMEDALDTLGETILEVTRWRRRR